MKEFLTSYFIGHHVARTLTNQDIMNIINALSDRLITFLQEWEHF